MWHDDAVKARQVCGVLCELLDDRGYALVDDDARLSGEERRQLREMPLVGERPTGQLAAVCYCTEHKMSVKFLRKLVAITEACPRLERVVVVVHDCVTHFAAREQTRQPRIQIFKYAELMYNVTRHVSVPRHTRVDPADVAQLLRDLKVRRRELPTMSASDVQVRYHGWPTGTLVRIERMLFGTTQIYYRLVT